MEVTVTEQDRSSDPLQIDYKLINGAGDRSYMTQATSDPPQVHDYDEPYFEPATEVDLLLEQLRELDVLNIEENSLM